MQDNARRFDHALRGRQRVEEWNIPGRQLPSRRGISAPLRTLTFNINNFRLQSAGFVVFTKCRIIFRKCFLKKSIQHLEKTIQHLVGPEIRKKMAPGGIKIWRKPPRRRLSPFLQCKYTTFFDEKQIAPSAF